MVLKFADIKDPILRQKAKPVGKIDKKIQQLIADMKETLRVQSDPEGIGLAAPQVGKSLQIFLVDFDKTKRVVINPKVLSVGKVPEIPKSKRVRNKTLEGCLSLPHYYGPITRADSIVIEYTDENGKKVKEEFTGFLSHIIQHEMDHLNGVLFVDHILDQKAPLYLFDGDEFEQVELV